MVYRDPMPRSRRVDRDPYEIDVNQVVAFNFRRIRELRKMTQEEAAVALEPYLGTQLKKGSISAIERSASSERRRVFTVHEVVGFAQAFDVAALAFFIPPVERELRLAGWQKPVSDLWRLVLGTRTQAEELGTWLQELGVEDADAAKRISRTVMGSEELPWKHFREFQMRHMLNVVDDDYDKLVDLFDEMRSLVERFEDARTRQAIAGDAPREAYRYATEVFLGRKLFGAVSRADLGKHPPALRDAIFDRGDVPWDEIVDASDPAVKAAVRQLAEAIEPRLRSYLDSGLPSAEELLAELPESE